MTNTGPPRSTFNSLSAGLFSTISSSAPSSSAAVSVVVTAVSLATPASDASAVTVAQALQNFLPVFVAALQAKNHIASVTSAAPLPASSAVPSSSPVTVYSSVSGTLTLPPFVPTFSTTSTITCSGSARLSSSITTPVMVSHVSSWPLGSESLASSNEKAFVVGLGHAPIPAKLVKKITNGEFVELADLLSANLRAVDQQPHASLSRFQFQRFRRLAPQAEPVVTPVPSDLLTALLVTWLRDASFSSHRASLRLRVGCTYRLSGATLHSVAKMAVSVLMVLFYQPTSSRLCASQHYWQTTFTIHPSRCTLALCGTFTLTTACQILWLTVCSFSGFSGESSVYKDPLPLSAFLSSLTSYKLSSAHWISPPGTISCSGLHAALDSLVFYVPASLRLIRRFDPSIHLGLSDVQADTLVNPTCFRIHIKCSKTNPFRVGCDVYIGRGNDLVCPLVALANFLALRGPSSGPLFCYTDGRPLTCQLLSSTVQSIVRLAGLPGNYSGHSFRIGAATTAASRGVPVHLIKTLGPWSSDAYQRYIRTSAYSLIQVSGQLA